MSSSKYFREKPDELGHSATLTADSSHGSLAGQAIDAWESEGGSAPARGEADLARTALPAISGFVPACEEDGILRCLGAAVIMRWNTMPAKLQRELFDNASSGGELLQAGALRGQIARFLHKHKDDAPHEGAESQRDP